MPQNAGNESFESILADTVNELIEEAVTDHSAEAQEFVEKMHETMHEGEMTQKTAETIGGAFVLAFSYAGGDAMRIDMGLALKELAETQAQHAAIWGGSARVLLGTALTRNILRETSN